MQRDLVAAVNAQNAQFNTLLSALVDELRASRPVHRGPYRHAREDDQDYDGSDSASSRPRLE